MELLNNNYTRRFGTKVTKSIVLDIDKENPTANLISDIRNLKEIANGSVDCIILTQVLQFIDDVDAAISECFRVLKPGGTILATMPSVSRIDCSSGISGDYWRFTEASAKYLFYKKFSPQMCEITSVGNARAGIYFLAGLSIEDVNTRMLDKMDRDFPVLINVLAIK